MTVYASPTQALRHWADAKDLIDGEDDTRLVEQLAVAQLEVERYAVALPADLPEADVPPNYMLATVYQARTNYDAGRTGSDGLIGNGDTAIRPLDLGPAARQMLPPRAPDLG